MEKYDQTFKTNTLALFQCFLPLYLTFFFYIYIYIKYLICTVVLIFHYQSISHLFISVERSTHLSIQLIRHTHLHGDKATTNICYYKKYGRGLRVVQLHLIYNHTNTHTNTHTHTNLISFLITLAH